MKTLLLGATGTLGSRCVPALLAHNIQVVVFVRSESKLKTIFPSSLIAKIQVTVGDASDSAAICKALVDNKCDSLVNCAGQAAVFPWQAPRMQRIIGAASTAAVDASRMLDRPIRAWFLGGMTALDVPGMPGTMIKTYFPLLTEHALTYACLSSKPRENLQWSHLCPSAMKPISETIDVLEKPRSRGVVASADVPPDWQNSHFHSIPLLGPLFSVFGNAMNYNIKLEDCAEFIATDLAEKQNKFIGHRVGLKEIKKSNIK